VGRKFQENLVQNKPDLLSCLPHEHLCSKIAFRQIHLHGTGSPDSACIAWFNSGTDYGKATKI
jgi:hypothetical protein